MITEMDDITIATPATHGGRGTCHHGYRTPAARGIAMKKVSLLRRVGFQSTNHIVAESPNKVESNTVVCSLRNIKCDKDIVEI